MDDYNTRTSACQVDKLPNNKEWRYSKTIDQLHVVDVIRTSFKPRCHIRKISKTEYLKGYYLPDKVFVSTGEVYTMPSKDGQQYRNRRSLRKIFKDLRYLINSNYVGGECELFVTLTYADQTNDGKQIHRDFGKFWERLKYRYRDHALKYISIVEPHESGNYHIHLLLQSDKHLYIPNDVMESIWGLGYTKTERLDNVDNIGAYFVAYFTNMELSPEEADKYAAQNDITERNGKKYIKGRRLDFYPDHFKIYRYSANISKPTIHKDAILPQGKPTYQRIVEIEDTESGAKMYVATEQYNKTNKQKT